MSTAIQPLVVPRSSALTLARDYAELIKLRVTTLIIMTAWCGYYFGALEVRRLFLFVGSVSHPAGDRPGFRRRPQR